MVGTLLRTYQLKTGYLGSALQTPPGINIGYGVLAGIRGRNGKGKTTLLKTIAGILPPVEGHIEINQININAVTAMERARLVSIVLTDRIRLGGISVRDLVEMGRYPVTGNYSFRHVREDEKVDACMRQLNITHLACKPLAELSDGELQKAMIARALAQETPVILMDEPTAFLDYIAREELFQLLKLIVSNGKVSVLFTSHDIDLMEKYATVIFDMDEGISQS